MRLVLSQTKNGLPSFWACFMKVSARGITSSASNSFIRSWVSWPVSVHFCLPTLPKRGSTVPSFEPEATQCSTPRVPKRFS